MKIKTIVCVILCFSFFLSSCKKEDVETELGEKTVAVEIDSLSYEAAQIIKTDVKEIKTFSTEDFSSENSFLTLAASTTEVSNL